MKQPIQITFRDMEESEALEPIIREKAAKLEQFYDGIISCRVVVEAPHRRHNKGNHFHVTIDLSVPGGELIADRDPSKASSHEDVQIALRDAFSAVTRELKSFVARKREEERRAAG